MKMTKAHAPAKTAILTLATVKSAVAAFDDGAVNVFDALEAIRAAVGTRAAAPRTLRGAVRTRRRAA